MGSLKLLVLLEEAAFACRELVGRGQEVSLGAREVEGARDMIADHVDQLLLVLLLLLPLKMLVWRSSASFLRRRLIVMLTIGKVNLHAGRRGRLVVGVAWRWLWRVEDRVVVFVGSAGGE